MWDESIAANRSAADAARAYAAMRHRDRDRSRRIHARDYMAYSYLKKRRTPKRRKSWISPPPSTKRIPELEFSAAYASARSRRVMRSNVTPGMKRQRCPFQLPHWSSFPFMEALLEYAHALGRAHGGDVDGARAAQSRGCTSSVMRRPNQSSIISSDTSTCKCRRQQPGSPIARAGKRRQWIYSAGLAMRRTFLETPCFARAADPGPRTTGRSCCWN